MRSTNSFIRFTYYLLINLFHLLGRFIIITKAFNKFYILKNIFTKINEFLYLKLYFTYILSILEFSNHCYIPTQAQENALEKVQKKITKFICYKLNKNN